MNPYSTKLIYKNVFSENITDEAISDVILSADFNTIEFTLYIGFTATLASVSGIFEIGETVEGGTSSATGVIVSFTDDTIILKNVTGTFTNAETITGGTSSATATIGSVSVPDFTIGAFTSNQRAYNGVDNPPDPTLLASPTNDYTQVIYSDEAGGINYDTGNPWNATVAGVTTYAPKTFRFGTDGTPITGKWCFLEVLAFTGGVLLDADIVLSNV